MEISWINGLQNLRLDKPTCSPKLTREPRRIKKPSLEVALAKGPGNSDHRYDPTWLVTVTGICVKVWQSKPGTGHDKEDNSLKANYLRKLAINALISSKRIGKKEAPPA